MEDINRIVSRLGYKIPGLHDPDFLSSLERRKRAAEAQRPPDDPARLASLKSSLLTISGLQPVPRGFAFERFLNELFDFHQLAPRASFRL